MMIVKRVLGTLCAAALLLAGFAGCSPSTNEADTAAINAAMDKLDSCTSFSAIQISEQEESVTAEGETFSYASVSRMELTLVVSPTPQMKALTTATARYDDETMTQTTQSYIVPKDGGYAEYYCDGTDWYVVTTEDADALTGFSAAGMASLFLADGMTFAKDGSETLSGGRAVRYKGILRDDALIDMLENSGGLSSISSMSESLQQRIVDNLKEDLDPLSVYVWVDEGSGYPVRFEMSLAETLAAVNDSINKTLGNPAAEEEWVLSKYVMTLELSDFNAVTEIVPPPEAADAIPYEEPLN